MSKKRGLSAEDKKTKMLEIFHGSRDFFQLKVNNVYYTISTRKVKIDYIEYYSNLFKIQSDHTYPDDAT